MTSNIGYGFKVKSYEDHPVKLFAAHGVPFVFCLDNWLLSGDINHQPDPNQEIIKGAELIGWEKVKEALVFGAKAAFSPSVDKEWIKKLICQIENVTKEYK